MLQIPMYCEHQNINRKLVEICGRASGSGVRLFWSKTNLYVLYNDLEKKWVTSQWKFLLPKSHPIELIEVFGKHHLMLYTESGDILLCTMEVLKPVPIHKRYWYSSHPAGIREAGIGLTVLRRIKMETYFPPNIRIQNFHFDWDRGVPYIFCFLDEVGTESAYTYQFLKLEFMDPTAPRKEKLEERWSPPTYYWEGEGEQITPKSPDLLDTLTPEILERVSNPWIKALLQKVGAYEAVGCLSMNS
jgi:hypothetical protein